MSNHKKYCIYGHLLAGENLRIKHKPGGKYPNSERGPYENHECVECHRQDNRKWWANRGRHLRAKRELVIRQTIAEKDSYLAQPKQSNQEPRIRRLTPKDATCKLAIELFKQGIRK